MKIIWKEKRAFSLVEILVALIAVSCISAALAPVITKKLKGNAVSVGGGGVGGGSGGGYGGDISTDCNAINANGKCIMCDKEATICYTCTESCAENEYRNDGTCSCHVCSNFHEKCIRCGATGCSGCSDGYGLLSGGGCEECGDGKYVNMEGYCATCPEGYYCKDGEKTTCPLGSFSTGGASECRNCSEIAQNCVECTENGCTKCKVGYKLEGGNFCKPASSTKTFITPGNHTFQVPDTTTEITVTLVSGGAGGGAGSMKEKTHTFVVSGNGGITADDDNKITTTTTGLYTWTLPVVMRNRNFKITACGGGGGGGGNGGSYSSVGRTGGHGAYIQNSILSTSEEALTIQIGGGGGYGRCDNCGGGASGGCNLGGGGGSSYGSGNTGWYASSCQSSGNWSKGGAGSDDGTGAGFGGYDPLFGNHGTGGCAGGSGNKSGGKGSYLAGGGGGGSSLGAGGGGGAPTLFRHATYAKNSKLVAGGGGGGGVYQSSSNGGGGGGGGGLNCGAGSAGANGNAANGLNGVSGSSTIFGSNYCSGGAGNTSGKNGAMRIFYLGEGTIGGKGGGAGQIVPEQTISVTPGETLIVTVGSGGAGGKIGYYDDNGTTISSTAGEGANEAIVSKIAKSDGIILLTTATSVSQAGASGGASDGSSGGEAGLITNGRNLKTTAMAGYSNTAGTATATTDGGLGGKTILEEGEGHCSAGAGGTSGIAGNDATGYGGCGGGGGGAGANGGAGAGGYVMIRYVE